VRWTHVTSNCLSFVAVLQASIVVWHASLIAVGQLLVETLTFVAAVTGIQCVALMKYARFDFSSFLRGAAAR
jgi:hypothetical protein